MKCNQWYNKSFAPQPDKKEVNNMGFAQQYILFSISSRINSQGCIFRLHLNNQQITTLAEEVRSKPLSWNVGTSIKFTNNLVSPLFSQGKISLIELQDTG